SPPGRRQRRRSPSSRRPGSAPPRRRRPRSRGRPARSSPPAPPGRPGPRRPPSAGPPAGRSAWPRRMTMADTRPLPVPDGLAGARVDVAPSRLLGLSRTRAAEIAAAGGVLLDGRVLAKSDRLEAGGWLEVTLPAAPAAPPPEPVVGLGIVHEDDDIVV